MALQETVHSDRSKGGLSNCVVLELDQVLLIRLPVQVSLLLLWYGGGTLVSRGGFCLVVPEIQGK